MSFSSVPLRSNITVIQVSNKEPPHTAIPVLGPETNVFDFEFKQKLTIQDSNNQNSNFINIVNTETNTVTDKPDYEHISLTTTVSLTPDNTAVNLSGDTSTVSLTDVNNEGQYERLCMASTSNANASPLPIRRIKKLDKIRKSSLPNLEVESNYECLFPPGNTITNISNGNLNRVSQTQNGRSNSSQVGSTGHSVLSNGNTVNGLEIEISRIENSRLRTSVERSRSQNAYDVTPRRRENRIQNNSPKREVRNGNYINIILR